MGSFYKSRPTLYIPLRSNLHLSAISLNFDLKAEVIVALNFTISHLMKDDLSLKNERPHTLSYSARNNMHDLC